MHQPFFITGLPCSRTAWLANLFTTGRVFCHHDLLAEVGGLEAFHAAMAEGQGPPTGDSDSGLLAFYPDLDRKCPKAPWLLVNRDFEDAWESLCGFVRTGTWRDSLPVTWEVHETMRAQWERMRLLMIQNPRVMEVPFASLDNVDTLERIWRHLVPGQPWDRRRAAALQKLRIQPFQAKCNIKPAFNIVNAARNLWPSLQES